MNILDNIKNRLRSSLQCRHSRYDEPAVPIAVTQLPRLSGSRRSVSSARDSASSRSSTEAAVPRRPLSMREHGSSANLHLPQFDVAMHPKKMTKHGFFIIDVREKKLYTKMQALITAPTEIDITVLETGIF